MAEQFLFAAAPLRFIAVWTVIVGQTTVVLAAEDAPGTWLTATITDAFQTDEGATRWHYWIDAQARYFDLGSGINQYLLRPAVGYALRDNLTAWLGYARFRTRNRTGNIADENRYWQQLSWTAGQWRGGLGDPSKTARN